jgi:hypothetical protein
MSNKIKKGEIVISIEDFNELVDFKKSIESGFTCRYSGGLFQCKIEFLKPDKAVEIIINISDDLKDQIRILTNENEELKKKSFWSFLRIKKQ